MLRRFIFILVLLAISFFVYRRINPEKADALVDKIRTTYNSILGRTGTVELLTGEVLTGDIFSGELLTGTVLTGIENEAPILPANTGANANAPTGETSVTPSLQATPETTGSYDTGTVPAKTEPQPTPKPASEPRTSSDTQDTQNLINSLFK